MFFFAGFSGVCWGFLLISPAIFNNLSPEVTSGKLNPVSTFDQWGLLLSPVLGIVAVVASGIFIVFGEINLLAMVFGG